MTPASVARPTAGRFESCWLMVAYGVSHVFNFTDPSVAIDTVALASSLTALHQTCLTLACRECFVVLSPTMPLTVNIQREAHLTPRKLFCKPLLSYCRFL